MQAEREIQRAIADYAHAYARLEKLQDMDIGLPRGDQKTGCIGEYYARLYLERLEPTATIRSAGNSSKAWDLEVRGRGGRRLILVKAVSAFSKRRGLSPIHIGWDELWVLSLDLQFKPNGFWIVKRGSLGAELFPLRGIRAPRPETDTSRSGELHFGVNRVAELAWARNARPSRTSK